MQQLDFLIQDIDLFTKFLLGIFLISFLVQILYYLIVFRRAIAKTEDLKGGRKKYPPVSIIISARNEAKNLEVNLPGFLEQDYTEYEVIVVNDRSDDNSEEVLTKLAKKYKHLKVSNLKNDSRFDQGKKLALTIGIKAAKNDILLLSDADCVPASDSWIKCIVRHYHNKDISLVLGVGLYKRRKGLLNLLIRFETAFIAMQYISLARMGKPYMGVGRNLSYKKDLFFRNRGFASHLKVKSGDDDLFVNEVSTSKNTAVEIHPDSFTLSIPEKSFRDWLEQKKRHLTTSKFYQQSSKRILGFEYISRMLLIISFILLLFRYEHYIYILGVYILVIIFKSIIYILVFKRFKEKFLFLPALLLDAIMPFVYSLLHFVNYIERKRSRWQ
jgi:cellulose synthase/poly-beta-1,6-N-acetylglucosamine synthase-like glycosyltransferase